MSNAKLVAMAALGAVMTTSCAADRESARSGVEVAFRQAAAESLGPGPWRESAGDADEPASGGVICTTEDGAPYESESC